MKSFPKLVLSAGLLAAGLVPLAGCEEVPEPKPVPPRVIPPAPVTWQSQTAKLAAVTPKLTDEINSMPGIDSEQHRKIAAATVKDLTQFFTLANGPMKSPAFANRIQVLTDAQKTLANPAIPASRMIAVENQALHVAALAASDITSRQLFDDPDLAKLVAAAMTKVNAVDGIDETNGPLHNEVAGDAFKALLPALVQINQDLQDRFGPGSIPVETPVAQPPAEPVMVPPTTGPTPPEGLPMDDSTKKPAKTGPADETDKAAGRIKDLINQMGPATRPTTMP